MHNDMEKKDRFIHKHGYAILFRHRELVEPLIKCFVSEEFYKHLDFSHFEACTEKTYITDEFKEFADDLVIKVRWKGKDFYIYIILEFQSKVERFMALRFLNYLTLFYLGLIAEHREANNPLHLLPPVMAIVFLNGNGKWTAPDNIKDLIQPCSLFSQFYPDFRYFKIIENEYSEERLKEINNVVSAVFLTENTKKERMHEVADIIGKMLSQESVETIRIMTIWLRQLLKNERIDSTLFEEVNNISSRKEAKGMLAEVLEELRADYKKGMAIGEKKGIAIGERKTRIETIINLIEHRFKKISNETKKAIASIQEKSVFDALINVALDAKTLDDINDFLKKNS